MDEQDRPADLILVLAVRRAPIVASSSSEIGYQVARFMADYSGICQDASQLPDEVFEAIKAQLQTKPEENLGEVAQKVIDFGTNNVSKVKTLVDGVKSIFAGTVPKKEETP